MSSAPESDSAAVKRPNELTGSGSSPNSKRLRSEFETPSTPTDASSTNKGLFELDADAAEDKGSRHTMEDAWVVRQDAAMGTLGNLRCAHFAIYDGHGGRLAAEYAQKHLHKSVLSAGLPPGY